MEEKKQPLLEIEDLSVTFKMYDGGALEQKQLQVISSLSVTVYPGEILAIAGSSGSGKSLLASAILGILPGNAEVEGRMIYEGKPMTPDMQKKLRGNEIALVPQSIAYLDPLMKIGKQVDGHKKPYPTQKRKSLFKRFGLPEKTPELYPFQLSGGMARRVLVSTALVESSRIRIFGSLRSVLAKAISWRCPCESEAPLSIMGELSPSGISLINSSARTVLQSSSVLYRALEQSQFLFLAFPLPRVFPQQPQISLDVSGLF